MSIYTKELGGRIKAHGHHRHASVEATRHRGGGREEGKMEGMPSGLSD